MLLGGLGYALDAWRGTSPWFLLAGCCSASSWGSTSWRRRSGGDEPMTPVGGWSAASVGVVAAGRARSLDRADAASKCCSGCSGRCVVAVGTWVLTERTYRRHPERLTALMIAAFGVKMLFFGAYVAVMLRVAGAAAVPFVASFTAYFIALYLIEALYLRRLFAGGCAPCCSRLPIARLLQDARPRTCRARRRGRRREVQRRRGDHRARLEQRHSTIR